MYSELVAATKMIKQMFSYQNILLDLFKTDTVGKITFHLQSQNSCDIDIHPR